MIRTLAAALFLLPVAAHALESASVTSDHTSATLVSEADSFAPGRPLRLALRLKMQPGWHTYWQNPGDAGAPPTLDITGAPAGPIAYPTPTHSEDPPFTSGAYTGEVLFPVTVTPPAGAAAPLALKAHGTWLVCAKVCVPEEGEFTLTLPAGNGAKGADAALFAATDAASPRPSPFAARIVPDGTLSLSAPGVAPVSLYLFPEEAGVIDHGAKQPFETSSNGLTIHLKPLAKIGDKPFSGVLTLTDQGGRTEALRIEAAPRPVAAGGGKAASGAPALPGLAKALVLAFLGGLVLNLMPCVLPVLAMKALALARLSGAARGRIRAESGLYTLGVLTAFAAIGAVTLAVRAAGGDGNWGAQFQSAPFTAAMAWLMLGIGLNFSGQFEVGAGIAGVGQGLAARGSFFTGLLAVVVATPCTAPFMATALAATLVLPPLQGMAIFLALGAGLAAPYAMLAAAPGLARFLPRPGAWMERLKHALALPMYAAAAWLAWVVWQQAGMNGLYVVLGGAGAVLMAGQFFGRSQRDGRGAWRAALPLVLVPLFLLGLASLPPPAQATPLVEGAERFTPDRLATLRAAHQPVFVDMSAAWCITCLVNERLALSPAPVRAAFTRRHVAYMVGDWTRQDPAITAFLRQYGRSGVPLYVYFPAQGEAQVLPQVLTQAGVLGTIGG